MRLRSFLLLFSLFAVAFVPLPAAAQAPCGLWDGADLHLAGRIGGADVVVYLDTGWPSREEPNGASGLVMDTARWRDGHGDDGLVALDGRRLDGCRLELVTLTDEAHWSLRIVSKERVEGTRQVDGGSEAIAFTVTAPFDCTAGPWKAFDDPRWPVTFAYPASARFMPGVSVACPDVSRLAWDASPLSIRRVPIETSRLANGRKRTTIGPFFSDRRGQWQVDDRRFEDSGDPCSEEPPAGADGPDGDGPIRECKTATMSRWHGFTVLQGESSGEDRGYRPGGGGYIGQGSGVVYYAFLIDKEAILVSSDDGWERIADLDGPPLPDERSTSLMAARIIRSLKRR